MTTYKLSALAEADIKQIIRQTINQWGLHQAKVYSQKLHETFVMLAKSPELGSSRAFIQPGTRCFPVKKHVIYYRRVTSGIEIARVLHNRMNPITQHGT